MIDINSRAAHTAEHAFIGSLQKLLNMTLNVRKVEHRDSYNIAYIKESGLDLDFEKIAAAEKEVNRLILEGRKILHHSFSSLNEAKQTLPTLRANETRLLNVDKIRVVEIQNHDLAACSMEHVNNLSECEFFLVTSLSKNGSDYEIRFMVGKNAMDEAVKATQKINIICDQVGANYNTIEATIKKLYCQNEQYYNQLQKLTSKILTDIRGRHIEEQNIIIISSILSDMDWRMILNFVGERILESRTIVILVNKDESDTANLVFARSDDVVLDCVVVFQAVRKQHEIGAGGGKPNFVNAKITTSMSEKAVNALISGSLENLSR